MSTSDTYFSECLDFQQLINAEQYFFQKIFSLRGEVALTADSSFKLAIHQIEGIVRNRARQQFLLPFKTDIVVPELGKKYSLRLGSKFDPNNRMASYSMAILCDGEWKCKLRFDFDNANRKISDESEPHPFSHLHTGGELAEDELAHSQTKKWDSGIKQPRIPCLPFCSALLWHLAFLEFKSTPLFAKILKEEWWNKIIVDVEGMLWKNYFKDLTDIVQHRCGNEQSALTALYFPTARFIAPPPSPKKRNR